MRRGGLNIGRLGGKQVVKALAGNNVTSRKRLGRWVSKARRRTLQTATLVEREQEMENLD